MNHIEYFNFIEKYIDERKQIGCKDGAIITKQPSFILEYVVKRINEQDGFYSFYKPHSKGTNIIVFMWN